MSDTLTCQRCGHCGDHHRHDDDLLDRDGPCHDEAGHHQCAHFRCRYEPNHVLVQAGPGWSIELSHSFVAEPTCDCPNFVGFNPFALEDDCDADD